MTDVLNLQHLLAGGEASPAVLYAAIDDGPVVIPDDGREHTCPCGAHAYRVAGHAAWGPHPTDWEGRWVGTCHGCGRELEAGR